MCSASFSSSFAVKYINNSSNINIHKHIKNSNNNININKHIKNSNTNINLNNCENSKKMNGISTMMGESTGLEPALADLDVLGVRVTRDSVDVDKIVKELREGKGFVVLDQWVSDEDCEDAKQRSIKLMEKQVIDHLDEEKILLSIKQGEMMEVFKSLGKFYTERQYKELLFKIKDEITEGKRLLNAVMADEVFGDILMKHVEGVTEVFEKCLGKDWRVGSWSGNRLYPSCKERYIHVDYPYNDGILNENDKLLKDSSRDYELQTILMLDDWEEHNGSTLVAPGSQLLEERPPDYFKWVRQPVKVLAKKGSVILITGRLWHQSGRNNTDKDRVAFVGQFLPRNVPRRCLTEHGISEEVKMKYPKYWAEKL